MFNWEKEPARVMALSIQAFVPAKTVNARQTLEGLMFPRTPNDFHWAPYHVLAMAMHASAQLDLEVLFDSRKRETTSLAKAAQAEKYVAAWWW